MDKIFNIGVDATTWQNKRGYGRFMRSLFNALCELDQKNRYTFYFDSNQGLDNLPVGIGVCIIKANSPTVQAASAWGSRSLKDILKMSRALSNPEIDLLIFPTIYSYVPVFSRAKKIVVIHDVIADRFPQMTLPSWKARLFWKLKVVTGCNQADKIITISDFSKKGITELLNIPAHKINVVNEAHDPTFRYINQSQKSYTFSGISVPESKRIILYVGGFGPHKNLRLLVNAFKDLSERKLFSECILVFVGELLNEAFFSELNELRRHITDAGIIDKVIFTGFLPDEELVLLLNRSEVLVLPSLIEGLGLPALEAAACRCPVIATIESPLPDLLGKGGIFIDPLDQGELERALISVLGSKHLQREMGAAGAAAVGQLSWEKSAQQMLEIISEMAGT